MNEILSAIQVTKNYSINEHNVAAVNQLSLHINAGEIVGIVGESGSGKSTLLKLFAGLKEANSGEIYFKQRKIEKLKGKERRERYKNLQMIFQYPKEAFHPGRSIGDSIREHIRNLSGLKSKQKIDERMIEAFRLVQFPYDLESRLPSQISGGQCQRAAIARAISCHPEVLLCDEITSALDVLTQEQIMELLKELIVKLQATVIFVSHDLALVSSFCNRIVVMYKGNIVEEGSTREVLLHPQSEYTKKLLLSAF